MQSRNAIAALSFWLAHCLSAAAFAPVSQVRRPVALALHSSQQVSLLYVANRDSGTVSIVDLERHQPTGEIKVGGKPVDLFHLKSGRLLVLDHHNHQLISLENSTTQPVFTRTPVAEYPIRILVDQAQRFCYVTSLWAKTITKFELRTDLKQPLRQVATVKLAFPPRELCLTRYGQYITVAGAFEAYVAVLNRATLEPVASHKLLGHNISGMAVDPESGDLLLSHQELNPLAHSTQDDVHWGNLMSNLLVSYPMNILTDPSANPIDHRTVTQLGEAGAAAADPGQLLIGTGKQTVVLLSGTHQVALLDKDRTQIARRMDAGSRPVDSVMTANGKIYVANQFDDTISVFYSPRFEPTTVSPQASVTTISLGKQPEPTLAQRGEELFYDGRLSHDGWMSCHSCHTEGHSNGMLNDNFSDDSFGTPKRVLSLLGVAETGPWAWNGETPTLEKQVHNSVLNTMRGTELDEKSVDAMVAFMKTLKLPRLKLDHASGDLKLNAEIGENLFDSRGCINCHATPTFTTAKSYDVGLRDANRTKQFNPPSLRGAAFRTRFLHDGRATSIRDVLGRHKHQAQENLTEEEVAAIEVYLNSLPHSRQ